MGMYFNVKKDDRETCPYCGEDLKNDYQSKHDIGEKHDYWGGCCERHKEPCPTLEKYEVENFYTDCENCGKWIEYNTIPLSYQLIERII